MPPSPHGSTCRDHLLDSAEEVVLRSGVGALTLDAVAAHAKVSKGGLLYHFPSKDALIESLVNRTCENWRSDYTQAIAAVADGPGRVPRGLMSMCIGTPDKWTRSLRRSSVVLVAVIANNPSLTRPLRDVYRRLFAMLKNDPLSAEGELVVLALNGLWFEFIFGLQDMSPQRLTSIRGALEKLLGSAETVAAKSKPVRAPVRRAKRGPAKR